MRIANSFGLFHAEFGKFDDLAWKNGEKVGNFL